MEKSALPPVENRRYTVQDLQDLPSLWYRIHVSVYDLRNFKEKVDSQARLDSIVDASYIGMPYFQPNEAERLKRTAVNANQTLEEAIRDTLDERLERRIQKRAESGDYRVRAAHDIAPVFENAFGIKPKDLGKDVDFLDLWASSGLDLKPGQSFPGSISKASLSARPRPRQRTRKMDAERCCSFAFSPSSDYIFLSRIDKPRRNRNARGESTIYSTSSSLKDSRAFRLAT